VTPRLGVVTVTHNSADVLSDFLASLRRQDIDAGTYKVYVIDNASVDDTVDMPAGGDVTLDFGNVKYPVSRIELLAGPLTIKTRG
jgi:GT2 family glycosyltransferase